MAARTTISGSLFEFQALADATPASIWVDAAQPIALADVVRYLVGVLEVPHTIGRPFEIGGPDVLTYLEMMRVGGSRSERSAPTTRTPSAMSRITA